MRFFPLSKNSIGLLLATLITFGFFAAGMFEVLDYFIIKA